MKYSLFKIKILNNSKQLYNNDCFTIKYIFRLIYEYHINNKIILFIGMNINPKHKLFSFIKQHWFIDQHNKSNLFNNGILSNKYYLNNKTSKLFKKRTPQLVIIFNISNDKISFIYELINQNIPIIIIGYTNFIYNKLEGKLKNIHLFGKNLNVKKTTYYKQLICNILLKK